MEPEFLNFSHSKFEPNQNYLIKKKQKKVELKY